VHGPAPTSRRATSALRRRLRRTLLLSLLGLIACAEAPRCGPREASEARRELGDLSLGEYTLRVQVEPIGSLHGSESIAGPRGRDAAPSGCSRRAERWSLRPVITAERGGAEVDMDERHDDLQTWWHVADEPDSGEALEEILESLEVQSCATVGRLAYRLQGSGYVSGWHGLHVAREGTLLHRGIDTDATRCPAALEAMGPIDAWLQVQIERDPRAYCDLALAIGDLRLTLRCQAGSMAAGSMPQAPAAQARAEAGGASEAGSYLSRLIAEGPLQEADLEGQLFALFRADAGSVPAGAHALLPLAPSPDRRRRFITDQLNRCLVRETRDGCAPIASIVAEAARLEDVLLCAETQRRIAEALPEEASLEALVTCQGESTRP